MNNQVGFPSQIKRVALMGATFETGNMGVGALAMGSLRCIYRAFPEAQVSFLDYGSQANIARCSTEGKERIISPINLRFSIKLFLPNNIAVLIALAILTSWIPGERFRKFLRLRNRSLRDIIEQDLYFSIAGGDSFSDIYGVERFLYVTLPQLLCILLDKPVVQLPQTIGPFKRKWVSAVAGYILRHSLVVFSRDHEGCVLAGKMIKKPFIKNQVRFSPDVAFGMEPQAPTQTPEIFSVTERPRPLVGINVSGLLWIGGYSGNNMFDLKFPYRKFIMELVSRFVGIHRSAIVLVSHVYGNDNPESDIDACAKIFDELSVEQKKNVLLLKEAYAPGQVKYLIGKCDFFIGARMHACIAALSQSVPAVGIAYSQKFKGVFAALEAEDLVVDPRLLTHDMAISACERLFSERGKWQQHLLQRIPAVVANVVGIAGSLQVQE